MAISRISQFMAKSILRRRFLAYMIDQIVIWWTHKIIFRMLIMALSPTFNSFPWRAKNLIFENINDARPVIYIFTVVSYYIVASWLGEGQTIGQKFLGIVQQVGPIRNLEKTPSFELLSYILRAVSVALFQLMLGVPFLLQLFMKDGFGLQDWISFSKIVAVDKKSEYFVVYGHFEPNSQVLNHHEYVFGHEKNKDEGLQLSLNLDFKNPSVLQLDAPKKIEGNKSSPKKAA